MESKEHKDKVSILARLIDIVPAFLMHNPAVREAKQQQHEGPGPPNSYDERQDGVHDLAAGSEGLLLLQGGHRLLNRRLILA